MIRRSLKRQSVQGAHHPELLAVRRLGHLVQLEHFQSRRCFLDSSLAQSLDQIVRLVQQARSMSRSRIRSAHSRSLR
jgi:hypothetical protein